MALDSYTNLILEVADLVNRDDLDDKVPTWIALVEAELQRVLKGRDMRTEVALVFDTTGAIALPADFGRPVSLTLEVNGTTWPIDLTTYERMKAKSRDVTGSPPRYAAIVANELRFLPTDSDSAYTGVLIYDADVDPLSDTNESNWVLAKHPDIYLYGAALHSAPYLKDFDLIATWRDFFDRGMAQVRLARDEAEFGANTPVQRPKSALGEC